MVMSRSTSTDFPLISGKLAKLGAATAFGKRVMTSKTFGGQNLPSMSNRVKNQLT